MGNPYSHQKGTHPIVINYQGFPSTTLPLLFVFLVLLPASHHSLSVHSIHPSPLPYLTLSSFTLTRLLHAPSPSRAQRLFLSSSPHTQHLHFPIHGLYITSHSHPRSLHESQLQLSPPPPHPPYSPLIMKYYSLALVASLASSALAAQVKFSVIAPGGSNVQVSVNGQNVALTAADPTVPVFTGTAETGSDTKYKYVVAGKTEPFDRALPTGASTYNDFFDRPVTYANIPELPWPIEKDVSVFRMKIEMNCFNCLFPPHLTPHTTPHTTNPTQTQLYFATREFPSFFFILPPSHDHVQPTPPSHDHNCKGTERQTDRCPSSHPHNDPPFAPCPCCTPNKKKVVGLIPLPSFLYLCVLSARLCLCLCLSVFGMSLLS